MNVLDLFSGIGGFSLGLERAGMRAVAFCEVDPYCRAVLAKHWPDVPCYDDVRTLTADRLAADGIAVDVICGGFPCQDISVAGAGAGLAGARSGLWREYARLIGEIRPRYVIVENVAALLGRGLGEVLGDLAALGFDAEWHCIPASAVGAPHRRDRLWIIAYVADARGGRCMQPRGREVEQPRGAEAVSASAVAHPDRLRQLQPQGLEQDQRGRVGDGGKDLADAMRSGLEGRSVSSGVSQEYPDSRISSGWLSEPDVGRVANGIPSRVDRLKCLGNAVVPQIPEIIGRAIMKHAEAA